MNEKASEISCENCGVHHCRRLGSSWPDACLTTDTPDEVFDYALNEYNNDPKTKEIFIAAAEVEGLYYGSLTRVEEVVLFAKRMGAKTVGIATCMGLVRESQKFAKILKAKGIESVCMAVCKVGGIDKTVAGISEDTKIRPGGHETTCNPIAQAKILGEHKTDLNVIVGLCVGHDTLFIQHSEAPVTYLIVKDRVLGHNPAAALYTTNSYYSRLLSPEDMPARS